MGDQAALQEAIQRARQLAAKISHQGSAPVKRSASTLDHSGPIKVTLAYEKPVNTETSRQNDPPSRQRSTSRDHNRNERDRDSRDYKETRDVRDIRDTRDTRDSRESRDSRDSRDTRDNNHNREPREPPKNFASSMTANSTPFNNPYDASAQTPSSRGGDEKIEIIIPHAVIGLVIGKGGENIKRIQNETGATVRVDPNTIDEKGNKLCTITGTKNAVEEARIQVENVIENAGNTKRPRLGPDVGGESYRMKIPASRTGAIIGKGGETIKSIKQQSGCDIELEKGANECGPDESLFIIRGTQDRIMKARALIEARLAFRPSRDGGMRDNQSNDHHSHHHSNKPPAKYVATGANAAPVSQGEFSAMPSNYPAGQQNSADMTAAWAAYFAQYSTLFNQAGAQPGAAAGLPFAGPSSLLGASNLSAPAAAPAPNSQLLPQLDSQQQPAAADNQGGQSQQDFSDQWIEYYLANGRPDYAEQIIQLKKQQQGQKQQQSQS